MSEKSSTEEPSVITELSDAWLVDKPSGWLVHPQRGVDAHSMTDWVGTNLGHGRSFPVHRLDRGTSGIMVWAKSSESARSWQSAWQAGLIRKGYLAIVRGSVEGEHFVDHPVPGDEGGEKKAAQSMVRAISTLCVEPRFLTLLEVEPYTGRYHQIRRHVKHLGHPLIGDSNYGRTELNRAFCQTHGLCRLGLHASWLHVTPDRMTYRAPLPGSLERPLKSLGGLDSAHADDAFKLFLRPRGSPSSQG